LTTTLERIGQLSAIKKYGKKSTHPSLNKILENANAIFSKAPMISTDEYRKFFKKNIIILIIIKFIHFK